MPHTMRYTSALEVRDLEVLRTLGRLHYASTRELVRTFFPSEDVARRRLKKMAGRDLIRAHSRGVPVSITYEAWRLTAAGLDVLAGVFPDELYPDGFLDRLTEGSLLNIDHREAVNRIYLDLLATSAPMSTDADWRASKERARALRARASQIWWQGDGAVVLRYRTVAGDQQIVPDATIPARDRPVRVFVELDRSTRSLGRIAVTIDRYRRFLDDHYARAFGDDRQPVVLFVVRSEGRQAGIRRLFQKTLAGRGEVLLHPEALAWLAGSVLTPSRADKEEDTARSTRPGPEATSGPAPTTPSAPSTPSTLRSVAQEVYTWARTYREALREAGQDLPPEGQAVLRRLYLELASKEGARG